MNRLLFLLLLVCASLSGVYVEARTNRPALANAGQADASGPAILQKLKRSLEKVGYTEVQVVPEIFVAITTSAEGNRVTLLVNTNTMQAMELEGTSDFVSKASERTSGGSR